MIGQTRGFYQVVSKLGEGGRASHETWRTINSQHLGPNQWTDVSVLALVVSNGRRSAKLDGAVALGHRRLDSSGRPHEF